ncbi:C40 family peptidase [Phytohabitans kaempferiae]|uniref:C40 family peptidase n=1 Tax=Phytohabitans kaempferiae TaxID=1620943 RepID=A0ABV6MF81_9ACTN
MKLVRLGLVAMVAVAAVGLGLATVDAVRSTSDDTDPAWRTAAPANRPVGGPAAERLAKEYELLDMAGPARMQVRRRADQAVVATLTVGARTVTFAGPRRRFAEPSTTAAVVESTTWVQVAPQAWPPGPQIPESLAQWLLAELRRDDLPVDVLAAAMQYLPDAPDLRDEQGVRYAGDAGFGYVHSRDERDGADFYDYLAIPWHFPDGGSVKPSGRWVRDLDCSGFVRLIYGYRFGIPLFSQTATTTVDGLPRTAASMAAYARSVVIAAAPSPSRSPTDLSAMQPGDLVFFALDDDDAALITHSGIYVGDDADGGMRFISSRGTVDGPTIGDVRGDGVIDSGYFGKRLRRVIRL